MKTVEVACPKCKQPNKFSSAELNRTAGRAVCEYCFHVFQLVKKNKLSNVYGGENNQGMGQLGEQDKVATAQILDKVDSIQMGRVRPEWRNIADLKFSEPSLSYRIPKATTKLKDFAEVKQQKPVVFNLIDPMSPSSVPAVSSTAYQADDSVSIPVIASETNNNVTIHTDSLVFTLVADGQNAVGQVNPVRSTAQTVNVSSHTENYYWTIATISALVVLILQLFYLMMMLI